jgi:hypothetical protein
VSFPQTVPNNGGELPITVIFEPTTVGTVTATATVYGDDPTPESIELIGEGLPNDPPVISGCDINPNPAIFGQAVTVTADVSDSATLSNIAFCRAFGIRTSPSTRFVLFNLVDNGSTPGDIPCDGTFTRTQGTGGAFARGTWEFTYDCQDKQGNLATGATFGDPGTGPSCSLLIGDDTDGDGLEDSIDPCPIDPENDQDGDGACESVDNCPTVANNGGPFGVGASGVDWPICAAGFPDCAVDFGLCIPRDAAPFSTDGTPCVGSEIDYYAFGVYGVDADDPACAGSVPACQNAAQNVDPALAGFGCGGDLDCWDPQTDSDGDGAGDACDPCPFDPLDGC